MDLQGFYASPSTRYGNGAANSGDAFGAIGQDTMQQVQKTGAGAVFDPTTSQNIMQQSQTTIAGQFKTLRPNRMLQLQEHQEQQQSNALPERRRGSPAAFGEEACVKRVTEYMLWLQNRPRHNSIAFWRNFVGEFYAPDAKKRLCVSMYDSRKITGVFPQLSWHCEICNCRPGHGLEANAKTLPRLFKIKFESGALDEFMHIDKPQWYHNSSGQMVLKYENAFQHSIFDQLHVVQEGQLRVVFSPELKIFSWEYCARRHEELVPRRLLVPQIGTLGSIVQLYRTATTAAASSSSSPSHMLNSCNMLANCAGQLAETFKTPLVNELGYSKRYVRSIQISDVVSSMKDLIDQFLVTGTGPIESLSMYSRRATKRPQSEQPSTQNPPKKKPLDFPHAALQLMCNSIVKPHGASSTANAAQFIGHRGTTLLRPRGPQNSTNIPLAVTYTTPSTPSGSMPPPRHMNAENSAADAMLFGQSNGFGGAMDVGPFGTDTIFIDDDLPASNSNMYARNSMGQDQYISQQQQPQQDMDDHLLDDMEGFY